MKKTPCTRINPFFIFMGCMVILWSCEKHVDPPVNKVPVADAGSSLTIQLPTNSVTLTGTGTDADGNVVAYLWSQISGPAPTGIVNPGSASTEVTNFIEGTYVFQLMVTDDDGATGTDTTSLVVTASPVQTLTLQPGNNPYEYQVENLNGQDFTQVSPEISIDQWTTSGQPWTLREIIKFDLSSISAGSTIISANLYLYSHPHPSTGNLVDANFGTSNSLFLQQVTANWSPSTLNWFNQPSTSIATQIIIPSTTQSLLDLNLDVTDMVSSMVSDNVNYGFLLKLQNEVIYNSRIFISSSNTAYPEKHPKLVVVYQ
jgi:hypothetical protein